MLVFSSLISLKAQETKDSFLHTRYTSYSEFFANILGASHLLKVPSTFENGEYILRDTERNIVVLINGKEIRNKNNKWGTEIREVLDKKNAIYEAYWAVQKAYDYFEEKLGFTPFNGEKLTITTGEGNYISKTRTIEAANPNSSTLDIVTHELVHGILIDNFGESIGTGPVAETFCDFFGIFAEHRYKPYSRLWLIGDEARVIRNPKEPFSVDVNFSGPNYKGVHELGKWLYISTMGEKGVNRNGKQYEVNGIGFAPLEKLFLKLIMDKDSFSKIGIRENFRPQVLKSAIEMFGEDSAEVIAMTNAFFAIGYGESHSKKTNIGKPIDSQSPSKPRNLSRNTRKGPVFLKWNSSSDNVGVTGYSIYLGKKLIGQSKVSSFIIPPYVLTNGDLVFSVAAHDLAGNLSEKARIVFESNKLDDIHCNIDIPVSEKHKISNIKIGDFENTSNDSNGYSDFTNKTISLKPGSHRIEITTNDALSEEDLKNYESPNIFVWIDFNRDTIFDEGELIVDADLWYLEDEENSFAGSENPQFFKNFSIPEELVKNKPMRMRIKYMFGVNDTTKNTPCSAFDQGEVEDYLLEIKDADPEDTKQKKLVIFPNPVSTFEYINIKGKSLTNSSFTIIDARTAEEVEQGVIKNNIINLGDLFLDQSTIYILVVVTQNGERITSTFLTK